MKGWNSGHGIMLKGSACTRVSASVMEIMEYSFKHDCPMRGLPLGRGYILAPHLFFLILTSPYHSHYK